MDFADVMCLIGIVGFGVMVIISLSAISASRKQKFQAREIKRIMDTYGLTEWPAEARWDSITGYKGRACYKLGGVSLVVLGEQGLLPGQLQKPAAATPQAHTAVTTRLTCRRTLMGKARGNSRVTSPRPMTSLLRARWTGTSASPMGSGANSTGRRPAASAWPASCPPTVG